jgi:23S rRNA (cytosine1962-C5)-methyltransferase
MDMIKNRIDKNHKKLKAWAGRHQIEAYRVYDRDIPEYPYIVDLYKDYVLIYDKTSFLDQNKNFLPHVLEAVQILFKTPPEKIIVKKRERQEGLKQYEKISETDQSFVVREEQAKLKVNLHDYLDTGLFLDHRPIRQRIFKEAKGKKFLNLFCYTGSVSVFAALGGAQTTNVDMSKTYIGWAQDNFQLNNIDLGAHRFLVENALQWMNENRNQPQWDVIFLDPPTFSNSKKMTDSFEVERDQGFLIDTAMSLLKPGGTLYFSTNMRKFKLEERFKHDLAVRDITLDSIPQDFHDKKIHQCFEIRHKTV